MKKYTNIKDSGYVKGEVHINKLKIFITRTQKEDRYNIAVLKSKHTVKSIKTTKEKLIEYWRWFDSMEDAENYIKSL